MPRNSYPAAAMVRSVPFARAPRASVAVCRRTPRSRRGAIGRRFARFFSRPGRFFLSPSPYYHIHERYVCVCVYIHARLKITIDRAGRDHAAFLPRGTGRGRPRRFFRLCGTQYCLHTHHRSIERDTPSGRDDFSLDSTRLDSTRLGVSRSRTMAAARRRNAPTATGDTSRRGAGAGAGFTEGRFATTNRARVGSIDRRRIE